MTGKWFIAYYWILPIAKPLLQPHQTVFIKPQMAELPGALNCQIPVLSTWNTNLAILTLFMDQPPSVQFIYLQMAELPGHLHLAMQMPIGLNWQYRQINLLGFMLWPLIQTMDFTGFTNLRTVVLLILRFLLEQP